MPIPPIPPSLPGLPKVPGATTGNFPTFTNNGGAVTDSGISLDDADTTTTNLWSAAKIENFVIQNLLNVPTLPDVRVATITNIPTLSGLLTVDGVALVANNFVLVKDQSVRTTNGIYKVQAGAWIAQKYDSGTNAYVNAGAITTYSELNINGGVLFVQAGATQKNVQFQCSIPLPASAYPGGSDVNWTSVTKLPIASKNTRFVDPTIGNNTTNNGSQSFPYATIAQAVVGASYPLCITLSSSTADASAVTWTAGTPNSMVQGITFDLTGGQQQISATQTFAAGGTRNDFSQIAFNTGASPAFVYQSGYLFRNNLENITVNTVASSWATFPTNAQNWISLNNVQVNNLYVSNLNLPAFTNPFSIYVNNQIYSPLVFTGTGAANTQITITNCNEYFVQVPPTFLGTIVWQDTGFNIKVGSPALPGGIITSQAQLTTILNWNTDTTYDGNYLISGFTPLANNFGNGDVFSKFTVAGVFTTVFYLRTYEYAPATVSSIDSTVYQQAAGVSPWVVLNTNNLAGHQYPQVYYVDPIGGLDTDPGTYSQPWQTITKAVASAPSNSIVYFAPGTYTAGSVLTPLKDNVVFAGMDPTATIFQANINVSSGITFYIQDAIINNGVTLSATSNSTFTLKDCSVNAQIEVSIGSNFNTIRCTCPVISPYSVINGGTFTAVDCSVFLLNFTASGTTAQYFFFNCQRLGTITVLNGNVSANDCLLEANSGQNCIVVNNATATHSVSLNNCVLCAANGTTGVLSPGSGNIIFVVTGGTLNYALNDVNYNQTFSSFSSAVRAVQPVTFDALTLGQPLPVSQGGTNTRTLTANGALVSNSAGTAVSTVAPGTTGNVLTSNGTNWVSSAPSSGTKVFGTWSVPPGSVGRLITIPSNATVQIVINATVPNGAISYIATISTTNNNVVNFGVQYAWYYIGNGLIWNSLPNNVVTTASGSISNANPAVTVPSNVLQFGLTNNTGATQTINYAYTVLS